MGPCFSPMAPPPLARPARGPSLECSVLVVLSALISGKLADVIGRKYAISAAALWAWIGTIIEISSSSHWVQFAMGRFTTGISIGALSVLVPMYQSESSPAILRGVIVACYQLFVTLGIWTAEMVDWGTESRSNSASWRIPNGLTFLWALFLASGILFLPESPRYAYRKGRVEEARYTIAGLAGADPHSITVTKEMQDIQAKLDEENAATKTDWYEIFTGPRMFYRTILGIVLQAGSVNVICTIAGLYIVANVGRRKALMAGAAWMMMCFLVYAFVGHFALDLNNPMNTPGPGGVMIAFSCLAIAAFASTWGPLVWAVVAELYPSQYRGPCMALATASNWFWNFMISFFTRFITDAIDYLYGLVFAGCCAALVVIVFFFLIESKNRSLEEIDTMYLLHVNPIKSRKWERGDEKESPRTGDMN
ncbi:hypothetical protein SAPIO_CDS6458 [Scedosporium apiospermum]|uniref:Major facilitator superfamily (MFS) profile domain-containing protein n=1 Tax=Pseudallescheria apiosperma TaxID=563466 RepID=A0A084G3Y2_PSEDA|nr:uncharacterized protein SAPIO_CDS6458 [Scedosporium apiospermum]KEZ42044.1 hypothetical protein SAPIO_CDS6458 [Scedosporium apiospermum]